MPIFLILLIASMFLAMLLLKVAFVFAVATVICIGLLYTCFKIKEWINKDDNKITNSWKTLQKKYKRFRSAMADGD